MRQVTKKTDLLWKQLATRLAPERAAALRSLCRDVAATGGRALLVGGCVRDAVWGHPPRDLDLEVLGVPPDRLRALTGQYRARLVGRHFPVLHLPGLGIDVSLPRRRGAARSGAPDFDADAE